MSKYLLVVIVVFLSGCGKYSLENRIQLADDLSEKNNFVKKDINTHDFTIRTYSKIKKPFAPLKIYLEGDGFAWVDKYTISNDPTPINPISLKLAISDNSKNVAYIARPCQYVQSVQCNDLYWSDKRYSKEIIENINEVVSQIKKNSKAEKLEIIGFSGGGAIAVLLSSMRNDVTKIITVAGNINHKLLHEHHHIVPMMQSLDAIDVVNKVSHIKQIHFVGGNDKIVPLKIAQSFQKKSKVKKNIQIIIIPDGTHTKKWDIMWKEYLDDNNNKK
jgi:hypothetical protein